MGVTANRVPTGGTPAIVEGHQRESWPEGAAPEVRHFSWSLGGRDPCQVVRDLGADRLGVVESNPTTVGFQARATELLEVLLVLDKLSLGGRNATQELAQSKVILAAKSLP